MASVIEIGGKAKLGDRLQTVSRAKFMVPIALPIDVVSDNERKERAAKAKASIEAFAKRPRTLRI